MAKLKATKKQIPAGQKRFDKQVEGLLDASTERGDLCVPFSCIYNAALDTADLDTTHSRNRTSIKKLIPQAVANAQDRAKFTTEWDWKAQPDEILAELNRVLDPLGITVQYTLDYSTDSVAFEFVQCPNNPANAGRLK